MKIILASQSKYKAQLLKNLGLAFSCEDPGVDEDSFKARDFSPTELCETLAFEKAKAIAAKHSDAIVIGADQLVSFKNEILGKAGTKENALEQLSRLSAHTHSLITSICVLQSSTKEQFNYTDTTKLTMRKLSEESLKRYIETDNPLDCAGSYKLEKAGIALFSKIETRDHTAIIGLPLIELSEILLKMGLEPELFRQH